MKGLLFLAHDGFNANGDVSSIFFRNGHWLFGDALQGEENSTVIVFMSLEKYSRIVPIIVGELEPDEVESCFVQQAEQGQWRQQDSECNHGADSPVCLLSIRKARYFRRVNVNTLASLDPQSDFVRRNCQGVSPVIGLYLCGDRASSVTDLLKYSALGERRWLTEKCQAQSERENAFHAVAS